MNSMGGGRPLLSLAGDRDDGCWSPGKGGVDSAPEPDEAVEQAHGGRGERVGFEYLAVEAPAGVGDAVERDDLAYFEAGAGQLVGEFLAGVAAEMTNGSVEAAIRGGALRDENDDVATRSDGSAQIAQRVDVLFDVFQDVQQDDGVEGGPQQFEIGNAGGVETLHLEQIPRGQGGAERREVCGVEVGGEVTAASGAEMLGEVPDSGTDLQDAVAQMWLDGLRHPLVEAGRVEERVQNLGSRISSGTGNHIDFERGVLKPNRGSADTKHRQPVVVAVAGEVRMKSVYFRRLAVIAFLTGVWVLGWNAAPVWAGSVGADQAAQFQGIGNPELEWIVFDLRTPGLEAYSQYFPQYVMSGYLNMWVVPIQPLLPEVSTPTMMAAAQPAIVAASTHVSVVPEPGTLVLFGTAIVAMGVLLANRTARGIEAREAESKARSWPDI